MTAKPVLDDTSTVPVSLALIPSPCSIVSHTLHSGVSFCRTRCPQFQVGSATSEDSRAVGKVVDRTDIRTECYSGVIKQARSNRFFRGFKFVDRRQ